jgi:FRG domain
MVVDSGPVAESRWKCVSSGDGIATFRLVSWSDFFDFIDEEVFSPSNAAVPSFVWRGHRRSDWGLSTTLDRLFARLDLLTKGPATLERKSAEHLESFKFASRGRRGLNPAKLPSENDWWALGQHFGLATPLLDWTRSPFAAAYFAFEENASNTTESRVVYALNQTAVESKNDELRNGESFEQGRLPIIEFIDPMSDENPRLVSQGGCFTRAPIGTPIEQWIANAFEASPTPVLLRVEIPNANRVPCLRALDRMNINHLSLFPDLSGASRSTNLKLELTT